MLACNWLICQAGLRDQTSDGQTSDDVLEFLFRRMNPISDWQFRCVLHVIFINAAERRVMRCRRRIQKCRKATPIKSDI